MGKFIEGLEKPIKCEYCKNKWYCYDRQYKGRKNPCNNQKEQYLNYIWAYNMHETPQQRIENKMFYQYISKINNQKVLTK